MQRFIILILGLALSSPLLAQKVHTVKTGETLSGIAQKNGTTVGDIMRLNGMTADSKLLVGAKIKIPGSSKPAGRSHKIASGETLSMLAEKYNTTVGDIMRLNGMNADSKLVIGESLKIPAAGVTVVRKDGGATSAVANDDFEVVDANTVTTFESEPTPRKEAVVERSDSYYASSYRTSGSEMITSGDAKIFKSASGWGDKKYFILMNDLEPGRVVKVQNGDKTIYAKVLWNLGTGKENQGLTYRISDAAAQALGVNGDKFTLSVTYYR